MPTTVTLLKAEALEPITADVTAAVEAHLADAVAASVQTIEDARAAATGAVTSTQASAVAAVAAAQVSAEAALAALSPSLAFLLDRLAALEGEVYQPGTLAFVGDSLTFGLNVASPGKYPDQVSALLAYTRQNLGVSGDTFVNLFARAAATDATLTPNARNILCVWCGTNDIEAGRTPTQIAADFRTYCLARRAAGWDRIVVLTTINRTANDVNFYTKQAALNTLLRTEYLDYADAVADVAAKYETQVTTNTTYFLPGDTIHLNATGYGIVADVVDRALTGFTAPLAFSHLDVDFVRPAWGTTYLTARGEPTSVESGGVRSAMLVKTRGSRFAVQFDAPPAVLGSVPATVAMWIKPSTLPSEAIMFKIPGLTGYNFNTDTSIYVGGGAVAKAGALVAGVWQSVIVGSNGGTQTWLKVQDTAKVTTALVAPTQSGASLGAFGSLGVGQQATGSYFDGQIAAVCIWATQVLTDAEITVYRNGGVPLTLAQMRAAVAAGTLPAPTSAWFFSPL